MTPAQLTAAKEVCKKRTPGEWSVSGVGYLLDSERRVVGDGVYGSDAFFIAATTHPETGYEAMVDEVVRLQAALDVLHAAGTYLTTHDGKE